MDSTGTADPVSPFSGGGLSKGTGIAVDGSGDIWVTNSGLPGAVSKFNTRGIPQSPSTGYTDGIADPSVIAIDALDNVWLYDQQASDTGFYYAKLNGGNGSLTLGVAGAYKNNPLQLAIAKSGNVWSAGPSSTQIFEIPASYIGSFGTQPVAIGDFSNPFGNPQGMAFDGSDRLWVAEAGGPGGLAPVPPRLSLYGADNYNYVDSAFADGAMSVAVDSAGNVWVLLGNNTVKEYVGVAAPVVTPLSLGVKENKLGAKP